MFLRRNRRRKDGESYEYWTLVESVRTARGPRQRVVATLGDVEVRLRLVATPERLVAELLSRLQLKLPSRPRTIQYVVENSGGQ